MISRKVLAFVRRDFLNATSYKAAFAYQVGTLFSSIFTVYFLSRMVSSGQVPSLDPYGGDYFSFAIIGVALADYLAVSLSGFSQAIRMAQVLGTLEAMLATPTSPSLIVIGSAVYRFLWSFLRVAIYLAAGLLLGAHFGDVQVGALVLTLFLCLVAFGAVGIIGASLILVLKAWNPMVAIFSGLSMLLGGVLYPVASMPEMAQWGARALPITYALEAMRGSLLLDKGIGELTEPLAVLGGFGVLLLPIALVAFRLAIRYLRKEGSIAHY
jgi:ABC-2 type transport system permease protein